MSFTQEIFDGLNDLMPCADKLEEYLNSDLCQFSIKLQTYLADLYDNQETVVKLYTYTNAEEIRRLIEALFTENRGYRLVDEYDNNSQLIGICIYIDNYT